MEEEKAKPDSGPSSEHLRDGSEKGTGHDYARQDTSTPSDDISKPKSLRTRIGAPSRPNIERLPRPDNARRLSPTIWLPGRPCVLEGITGLYHALRVPTTIQACVIIIH